MTFSLKLVVEWRRLSRFPAKIGTLRSNDADGDENVKKNNRFYEQNNSFARASHFFCTFLSRFLTSVLCIATAALPSNGVQFACVIACVAGVKRGRGRGNLGARGRKRVVSRPNSLPLPFRTPATQATRVTVRVVAQLSVRSPNLILCPPPPPPPFFPTSLF